MNVNRIDVSHIEGNELQVLFFSDQHIGSKDCSMKDIEKQIKWIKKTKNVIVIMPGDVINSALRDSVGAGCFDDIMTPSEQIDKVIELLTPIKDKIVGIHNGNHGNRIYNVTSISPEKTIARALGVPYCGDSCFHHIRFGNQTYIIYVTHGSTGAITLSGALNACMKYSRFAEADIYAMGHTHKLASCSEVYYRVNLKNKTMEKRKRFFVLCGSYVKWKGSYAEAKGYGPQKIGSPKAVLKGDKRDIRIIV
ncbi:hypothetical protein DRN69_00640 [Candidatus Pacearchaeota archaeon]|nr:MAG: hypothetical protein DRN69_00640 [Candidatus Pacearchaeota archaeon]